MKLIAKPVSVTGCELRFAAAVVAVVSSAYLAFADPAVEYKFAPENTALGTTPAEAYSWDDSSLWTPQAGGYPSSPAVAVDMQNCGSTLSYVKIPSSGVDIGALKSLNSKLCLIGDGLITINSDGYSSSTIQLLSAGRIYGGPDYSDLIIYAPVNAKNAINGRFSLACDLKMTAATAVDTLPIGIQCIRADLYANSSDPDRTNEVYLNKVLQGSGAMVFYMPRGSSEQVSGSFNQTANSPFLQIASGIEVAELPVGALVTGDGIPQGAFLKRIFPSGWVELSSAATATASENVLTFGPIAQDYRAKIEFWDGNNAHSVESLYLNKYRREDGGKLEITTLKVVKNVNVAESYFQLSTSAANLFPATLVLHKTSDFKDNLRIGSAAHLELVPDLSTSFFANASDVSFKDATSSLRITVGEGHDVSFHPFGSVKGKFLKDGAGTLRTGFSQVANAGSVTVEAGTLTMTNSAPRVVTSIASLSVSNGATFELGPNMYLSANAIAVEPGARITLAEGAELHIPHGASLPDGVLSGSGILAYSMPGGGCEPVFSAPAATVPGTPAFWIDACTLTNDAPCGILETDDNGDVRVARWNDCRGGEDKGYMFCTNVAIKPQLVAGATPYVHIEECSPQDRTGLRSLVWNVPLTNIRAVFAVLTTYKAGAVNDKAKCGAILGATRRLPNSDFLRGGITGSAIFYPNNNDHVLFSPIYRDGVEVTYDTEKMNEGRVTLLEVHPTANAMADAFRITDSSQDNRKNRFDLSCGGCVHEYIIYTNALTYAQRVSVAEYLSMKWQGRPVVYEFADAEHRTGAVSSGVDKNFGIDVPAGGYVVAERVDGEFVKTGEGTFSVFDTKAMADIRVKAGNLELLSRDPYSAPGTWDCAYLHLDASAESAFEMHTGADGVQRVTKWKSATPGLVDAELMVAYTTNAPTVRQVAALGGMKVVDFGPAATTNSSFGDDGDFIPTMKFEGSRSIQAVFAVVGSAGGGNALLGGTSGRNDDPAIATKYHGLWRNVQEYPGDKTRPLIEETELSRMKDFRDMWKTEVREDNVIVNQTAKGFTGGYNLYSVRSVSKMSSNLIGGIHYGATYGGVEFGELLYLTEYPSQEMFARTTAYFRKKWFGVDTPGWTAATANSAFVDDGAMLTVTGDAPLTTSSLGGGGTISGNVILASGGTIVCNGLDEVLSVTGTLTLPKNGTLIVNGIEPRELSGLRYTIVDCPSLSASSLVGWNVIFPDAVRPAARNYVLEADGDGLSLAISPVGMRILVR